MPLLILSSTGPIPPFRTIFCIIMVVVQLWVLPSHTTPASYSVRIERDSVSHWMAAPEWTDPRRVERQTEASSNINPVWSDADLVYYYTYICGPGIFFCCWCCAVPPPIPSSIQAHITSTTTCNIQIFSRSPFTTAAGRRLLCQNQNLIRFRSFAILCCG